MSKLFWVTAANRVAAANYEATLRRGVPVADISKFLDDSTRQTVAEHAVGEKAFVWGARPGSGAERKWERLERGDIGLVYTDGRFRLLIRVYAKVRSSALAAELWGNIGGQTWDCVFFVDVVRQVSLPHAVVMSALGYSSGYRPQGFEIPGEKAQQLVTSSGGAEPFIRSLLSQGERADDARVLSLLELGESENLEFKETAPPDDVLAAHLAAFANTAGGTLVIGFADRSREVRGVPRAEEVVKRVLRIASEQIEPTLQIDARIELVKGKRLVVVEVPRGNRYPYIGAGRLVERQADRLVPISAEHALARLADPTGTGETSADGDEADVAAAIQGLQEQLAEQMADLSRRNEELQLRVERGLSFKGQWKTGLFWFVCGGGLGLVTNLVT